MTTPTMYEDTSKVSNAFSQKVRNTVATYFPFFILVLNLLFNIFVELFDTHLNNPFTLDFLMSYVSDVLTTMLVYTSFLTYGAKQSKLTIAGYQDNCNLWAKLSADVRETKSEEFYLYCNECLEKEREEKRKAIICNRSLVSWQRYLEQYKGKGKEAIRNAVQNGEITPDDAKVINKANKHIRIKPINPLIILCGVHAHHINDAGRERISTTAGAIMSRPIMMFVSSFCIRMLSGTFIGVNDKSILYNMLCSTLMLVLSSVLGYSAGEKSTHKDHDRIKARIFFLERFIKA